MARKSVTTDRLSFRRGWRIAGSLGLSDEDDDYDHSAARDETDMPTFSPPASPVTPYGIESPADLHASPEEEQLDLSGLADGSQESESESEGSEPDHDQETAGQASRNRAFAQYDALSTLNPYLDRYMNAIRRWAGLPMVDEDADEDVTDGSDAEYAQGEGDGAPARTVPDLGGYGDDDLLMDDDDEEDGASTVAGDDASTDDLELSLSAHVDLPTLKIVHADLRRRIDRTFPILTECRAKRGGGESWHQGRGYFLDMPLSYYLAYASRLAPEYLDSMKAGGPRELLVRDLNTMSELIQEAKVGDFRKQPKRIKVWEEKLETIKWRGKLGSLDILAW